MATLIDSGSERVVLTDLEIADTFWKRFIGLQGRRTLPAGAGLWLAPCSSLHTCFMRFSIDVIMLDPDHLVIGIRRNLRPWRIALCERGTTSVVETSAGAVDVPLGTKLCIET